MAAKTGKGGLATITIITIIFVAAIVLLVLFGLWPQYRAMEKQENRIARLSAEIDKQKILHPIYMSLYKKAQFEEPEGLPFPKLEKLRREDLGRLSEIFTLMADESNLQFDTVLPQVNSLNRGSGLLLVDVSVNGDFFDLRKFLINLSRLSYLEHTERIKIQRAQGNDNIGLRLWMALE